MCKVKHFRWHWRELRQSLFVILSFLWQCTLWWNSTQEMELQEEKHKNISDFTWDVIASISSFEFNVPTSINIDQRHDDDDADESMLRFFGVYQLITLWRSFITNSTCWIVTIHAKSSPNCWNGIVRASSQRMLTKKEEIGCNGKEPSNKLFSMAFTVQSNKYRSILTHLSNAEWLYWYPLIATKTATERFSEIALHPKFMLVYVRWAVK